MSKSYETPWYARGDMGEYVLSVVESVLDGMITDQQFINKLYAAGLNDQEIMTVFSEDVLGV
jgi:hypothetical protein